MTNKLPWEIDIGAITDGRDLDSIISELHDEFLSIEEGEPSLYHNIGHIYEAYRDGRLFGAHAILTEKMYEGEIVKPDLFCKKSMKGRGTRFLLPCFLVEDAVYLNTVMLVWVHPRVQSLGIATDLVDIYGRVSHPIHDKPPLRTDPREERCGHGQFKECLGYVNTKKMGHGTEDPQRGIRDNVLRNRETNFKESARDAKIKQMYIREYRYKIPNFKDREFAKDWSRFHREVARCRMQTAEENPNELKTSKSQINRLRNSRPI